MFLLSVCVFVYLPAVIKSAVITQEFLDAIPPVNFSLANATPSDVQFAIFTQQTPDGLPLEQAEIKPNLATKVFVHSYLGSWQDVWYGYLKDAYLMKKAPVQVIYVDWSKAASLSYPESAANINPIAEFVADLLIKSQIPAENLHLIGASLGGQLVGLAGQHYLKKKGAKLARITALDAAKSGFEGVTSEEKRLSSDDAQFVDAVHTDSGFLGYGSPLGHVDFYPNGGKDQPGCPPRNVDSFCSHGRAVQLFVESVAFPKRKAVKAEISGNEVKVKKGGEEVVFGEETPKTSRGVFYLATNAAYPYLNDHV